ncbi:MAG: hypothetical protein A3F72_00565 [Bacteroidetes bacterium RIFCSPLOWO2_12_FULL_35_15]|nr:MAG: hypothetical protein A3F72_00565 [Bacteroidetes bacterium RIFCSPLOWO2_12_FULL_35_15]
MKAPSFLFICLLFTVFYLSSCGSDDDTIAPKPRAYFRLTFPEKKYVLYDSVLPFTFEIPSYSKMEKGKSFNAETAWLNLNFPTFNGTLNLTYKELKGDLIENLEETYHYASKHQIKASGISQQTIAKDSSKVYGLIYEIEGNAASSFQFFLTDSTKHFLRGALYFNVAPNTDSISPVLKFIQKDIYHMIETFEWKKDFQSAALPPKKKHK